MTIPTQSLDELIILRDRLKITVDAQGGLSLTHDAGEAARAGLRATVGEITRRLHEPFRIEAERLTQKRSDLASELDGLNHQRAATRNALESSQGFRSTALAAGDSAVEHTSSSRRLAVDLEGIEQRIGELELRRRGVEGQLVALVEAESVNVVSGVSAS